MREPVPPDERRRDAAPAPGMPLRGHRAPRFGGTMAGRA